MSGLIKTFPMYLTVEVAVKHNTCFTLFSNDMCFLLLDKILNNDITTKVHGYIQNNIFIINAT